MLVIKKKVLLEALTQSYPFIFALLPERLAAESLLSDILNYLFIEKRVVVKNYYRSNKRIFLSELKLQIYRCAYQLAQKRITGRNENWKQGDFFRLKIEERAILFLKYHTEFTVDQQMEIIQKTNEEYYSLFYLSRSKMTDFMGISWVV